MTAKVSKKNSFSTLSYQVLWLGSGICLPRTIPLGPTFRDRIDIALGTMTSPKIGVHDDVKNMSEQELYRRYKSIKKPWWNSFAEWIEDSVKDETSYIYKFLQLYYKIKCMSH